MCMCVCVCVLVCVYIHTYMCVYVIVCVCVFVFMFVRVKERETSAENKERSECTSVVFQMKPTPEFSLYVGLYIVICIQNLTHNAINKENFVDTYCIFMLSSLSFGTEFSLARG